MFVLLLVLIQTTALLTTNNIAQSQTNLPEVLGASTAVPAPIINKPEDKTQTTITQIKNPDLSDVIAQSFLVFDLDSGQELLSKNPTQKLAIASLTKLMTALVAYNNSNLNKTFAITSKDILNVKPDLGLAIGDEVKSLDVFNSMLIGSCNDAAKALADFTSQSSGSNFVDLMNGQAAVLGMVNSSFSNPMGFDNSGNYSTAEDLKLLITNTQHLSEFTDLGRLTGYKFSGVLGKIYSATATNLLIKNHSDIQAVKTGFTNEANGAMATKVTIGRHQIIILVLDSQNREGDTLKLKSAVGTSFNWE
jgi:D-alanyl-D-alanine carboxypeptidase (penicillin-binding protein 5/6)